MPVVKTPNIWKTVDIPESVTAKKEFEFLSAFEEIDDYSIVQDGGIEKEKKSGKKCKKLQKSKRKSAKREAKEVVRPEKERKKRRKDGEDAAENEETAAATTEGTSQDAAVEGDSRRFQEWQELPVPDEVFRAIRALGFTKPTTIQKLCLPCAIRDRVDIVGAAETGSGKTLAFAIPVIAGLLQLKKTAGSTVDHRSGPLALILTPTRELAMQVKDHMTALAKYTGLKVAAVIGGLSAEKQARVLRKRPEILIGTPGRLWYFMSGGCPYLEHLDRIRFLVIDETDRMLEKSHFDELQQILKHLNSRTEDGSMTRQTFVFSATLTFCHAPPSRLLHKRDVRKFTADDKIASIVSMIGLRAKRRVIDVTAKFGLAEQLKEARICCSSLEDKDAALYFVLHGYPGRTIVFTNSINCARRLRSLLQSLRYSPYLLFSAMNQKHRLTNLEKFTRHEHGVLIATDVAARGLDIKNIQHVVHYQVPRTTEIYVHRSGRTARVDKEGISIMLVDTTDVLHYKKIINALNKGADLPTFPVDVFKFQELKQRVRLATELESLRHRCSSMNATERWFRHAAKAAEMTLDDEVVRQNAKRTDVHKLETRLRVLQQQLDGLLDKPLKCTTSKTKYPMYYKSIEDEKKNAGTGSTAIEALNAFKASKWKMREVKSLGRVKRIKDRRKQGRTRRK